jgi:DNA-binding response OmpR family regulator
MGLTILLADDSPTIQRLVLQTFADTSFDVVCVNNGDAAIRKFEEIHPDVVLADIYMPGKDGFEVCAYVRSHSPHSRTPVILLVGAFDAFDEVVALQAGAAAHITKPFEPQALIDLVIAVSISAREPQAESRVESLPLVPREETPSDDTTRVISEPAVLVPAAETQIHSHADTTDLLGLNQLFQPEVAAIPSGVSSELSAEQIDIIVDRVLKKLSTRVVESIAWDVVPDIAAKIVRDELKRTTHEG